MIVDGDGGVSPCRRRLAAILRPPQAGFSRRTASTTASISSDVRHGDRRGRRDCSSRPEAPPLHTEAAICRVSFALIPNRRHSSRRLAPSANANRQTSARASSFPANGIEILMGSLLQSVTHVSEHLLPMSPVRTHLNGEECESLRHGLPPRRLRRGVLLRFRRLHELLAGLAARSRHHRFRDRHAVHGPPAGERGVGVEHRHAGAPRRTAARHAAGAGRRGPS